MIRSAMVAAVVAALAAGESYAQTPGTPQPQTPPPTYPYKEVERPSTGDVIRDVVQDAVDAAAARAREERRRERIRREQERLEWERQQAQNPAPYYPEPPVAVGPTLPEPSSPADPELNPERPAKPAAQPAPTRDPVRPKPTPPIAQVPPAKPAPAVPKEPAIVDPKPTAVAIAEPVPPPPLVKPPTPPKAETQTCWDRSVIAATAACPRKPSPASRWWPLALLGFGIAAAGGGWSVQQRRARLARTRAALSLKPRLDQQAGTSSTSPIKLAAPRVSIRTRLEYG